MVKIKNILGNKFDRNKEFPYVYNLYNSEEIL